MAELPQPRDAVHADRQRENRGRNHRVPEPNRIRAGVEAVPVPPELEREEGRRGRRAGREPWCAR